MSFTNRICGAVVLCSLAVFLQAGCGSNHSPEAKPKFDPGEGAISGKLTDPLDNPFDLSQAGDGGAKSIQIELFSPARGAETTTPQKDKPNFVFSHIKPGRYEISVYAVVTGKRTIAGSAQATVNPGQVTPISLPLTVTPIKTDAQP
jgi:hypothetical protein